MRIYQQPPLSAEDLGVLSLIQRQREELRYYTQNTPRRWMGSLRRLTLARAVQGSNSIEGYDASLDEAVAAIDDDPPLDPREETWRALTGYRQALTYILQAVRDPSFQMSEQFLKSLHFMMIQHEMKKNPGQYRPGSIRVVNEKADAVVYEAPTKELVEGLMKKLVEYLVAPSTAQPEVRAAMAHLNLTMIHPFSDGNGRMARAVQTLVLAREGGHTDPMFASIEEWLGANTDSYYAVLAEVGQGSWRPDRDATPWVRFCLKAHFQQSATVLRRNSEYAALFELVEQLRQKSKLHSRVTMPLFESALGITLTNSRYQALAEVEGNLASRDLKMLSDAGFLIPKGEKRGRIYSRSEELAKLRKDSRQSSLVTDPYELIRKNLLQEDSNPRLPGF